MDLQEIIKKLSDEDKSAIRGILKNHYSKDYIRRMFKGNRKPNKLFSITVLRYWEGYQQTLSAVNEVISNHSKSL